MKKLLASIAIMFCVSSVFAAKNTVRDTTCMATSVKIIKNGDTLKMSDKVKPTITIKNGIASIDGVAKSNAQIKMTAKTLKVTVIENGETTVYSAFPKRKKKAETTK